MLVLPVSDLPVCVFVVSMSVISLTSMFEINKYICNNN